MSRLMTKPTKRYVRPAKTRISLGIRPVRSESTLCAQWITKNPSFLHADSEDSGRIKHDLLQTQVLVLQLNFLNY